MERFPHGGYGKLGEGGREHDQNFLSNTCHETTLKSDYPG